jgi:hypothetical protein
MASSAIFGIYSRSDQVEAAVGEMTREGFRKSDISILFPRNGDAEEFALELDNPGLEGASMAAACGAVLGSALGWLVGAGAVAIPGLEPYIGHGPILSLLSDTLIGATLGGIAGGLTGTCISAYQALRCKRRVKDGKILLSVHCDDIEWTRRARHVLERTGGSDIVEPPREKTISQPPVHNVSAAPDGPVTGAPPSMAADPSR